MSTKTAKVTLCTFNNVYNPPSGGVLHVHTISLDNGDLGKIYAKSQYPPELASGQTISYSINEKSIIKIEVPPNPNATVLSTDKKPQHQKPSDLIGISFSYAKDLLVAKMETTKAPVKTAPATKNLAQELIDIAIPIYNKMAELRKAERDAEEKP